MTITAITGPDDDLTSNRRQTVNYLNQRWPGLLTNIYVSPILNQYHIPNYCRPNLVWTVWSKISRLIKLPYYMGMMIKWKHIPRYWPFVRGIHRSPVNSPHKGQWRGALMFSLICARTNGWVNNRGAGDLRHHRTHYDVIVMESINYWVTLFPISQASVIISNSSKKTLIELMRSQNQLEKLINSLH